MTEKNSNITAKVIRASQLPKNRPRLVEIFIDDTGDSVEVAIDPRVFEFQSVMETLIRVFGDVTRIIEGQLEATKAGQNSDIDAQLVELEKEGVI